VSTSCFSGTVGNYKRGSLQNSPDLRDYSFSHATELLKTWLSCGAVMQNTSVLQREVKAEYIHKDFVHCNNIVQGYSVAQSVEALRYKQEDRGFDF